MNATTHIQATEMAMKIANHIKTPVYKGAAAKKMAAASADTDHFQDLEFVHVKGRRDDPHKKEQLLFDDQPHFQSGGLCLTVFNHYIDIKKGPGIFDDYDGYSYYRGSAHLTQYQKAHQRTKGLARISAKLLGFTVDEGISYWLNDEYINTGGRQGCRGSSPALRRYSYPREKGKYKNKRAELAARFPLAAGRGKTGHGFPYSVFMPVDNLARYWFEQFLRTKRKRLEVLGPVLHAVQDASVPHHAAGYSGNWHVEYEKTLEKYARRLNTDVTFQRQVRNLVIKWCRNRAKSPEQNLRLKDRNKIPGLSWEVQQLVTWQALQAYHIYAGIYHHFKYGFKPNLPSMRKLYKQTVAMSALVLLKAIIEHGKNS
ncbi:hypothetical protein KAR34_07195 [bacterium]|nr:hypothetical protein [bacterium]